MAIDSIVAIPIDRFDLDLVTPKPKCIKKKGVCIPFTFPDAPDQSAVVKFVTADEDAAENLPDGIADPNEKLLYVSGDTPIVDITGPVHVSENFVSHFVSLQSDVKSLKHESKISGHSSNPVCGFPHD